MFVQNLRRLAVSLGYTFAGVLTVLSPAPASAADSLSTAITNGKFGLALRYRLEHVDQQGFDENALASTLRARLNFKSEEWHALSLFVEFDYVAEVLSDDYNAGAGNTPNRAQYPVVADPKGPDLNQAGLQLRLPAGQLVAGRQRLIFDNARFVGNVGWRQNEQTYDAATYSYKTDNVTVQLAYVDQVNRIFGRDVPEGRHDQNTWLANMSVKLGSAGTLTGYYYDIDDQDSAAFSTRSIGARLAGSAKQFGWTLEYARQNDAHDNAVDYHADYYRIDLSAHVGAVTPYLGYESLGGDSTRPGASFRTPLATLHAFNGWADMFLATPGAGLEDLFVGVKGSAGSWDWNVLYHDFNAESGSGGFGTEWDASLSRKFLEHYSVLFKGARFNADSASYTDVTKLWLMLTADF